MIADDLTGKRVLILVGVHTGHEGMCLGRSADGVRWAISPDGTDDVLQLFFDKEFGILLNSPRATNA